MDTYRDLVRNSLVTARAEQERWAAVDTLITTWDTGTTAEYEFILKQLRRLVEDLEALWERVK